MNPIRKWSRKPLRMPEGDTIHKLAGILRKELLGQSLQVLQVRGVPKTERFTGVSVESVVARGKHMLLHLGDVVLRVHLGMKGSWHHYKPGASWKRSEGSATVVLQTAEQVYVCFQAQDVELIPSPQLRWHRTLSSLGQDLLAAEEPDWGLLEAEAKKLRGPQDTLGELLLDQRIAAGLGNVYKSEIPFMGALGEGPFSLSERGLSPWLPWTKLSSEELSSLYRRARGLLQANLGGWPRTTRVDRRVHPQPRGGNLYVYGRAGKPCFRCETRIRSGTQGLQNRLTYWCPGCQAGGGEEN